jgi:hypothetical protein
MKFTGIVVVTLAGSFCLGAHAQVYSQDIVGYINLELYAGNNLLANQQYGVPEGSTFTEWNAATQQYLPASVYDATTGWSINYSWGYGQGGLFNSPTTFTNTFVGAVWPGYDISAPFVPPLVANNGAQLLACYLPIAATYYDVMGRDPQNGDSVTTLDGPSQTSTTTFYDDGAWSNGTPLLAVGQAAIFDDSANFDPDALPTPEPASLGLAGIGLLVMAITRKCQRAG